MKGVLIDVARHEKGKPLTVNEVRMCSEGHTHVEGTTLLMPGNSTTIKLGDVKITVRVEAE